MTESRRFDQVTDFYDTHPINEHQILEKLERDGVDLNALSEDQLQAYDQDHYGGLAANDKLAELAGITASTQVLDVCCGMGGPARYLAHKYGCRVTGNDLTQSRVDGATKLTAMAGLDDRITFRQGNALDLAFDDGAFDVVISQESFCHIPDKDRLIAECVRVLKPGGRMAFTDIMTTERTAPMALERLSREMTMAELSSPEAYRRRFTDNGCEVESFEDLSKEWHAILVERLAMYRSLEDQTVASFGQAHFDKWDSAYAFFVGLYETGEMGGGRILARRGET